MRERIPQARVQWQRELGAGAGAPAAGGAAPGPGEKEPPGCCGQDMTKLGVSTFQLGEHTFLGGDLDHLLSGSLKMAVFRCEVAGPAGNFLPGMGP